MSRLVQNTRLVIRMVAVIAILVVVNVAAAQWDKQWDMTESGLYSISDQTRRIAQSLESSAELIFFHMESERSSSLDPKWVRTLLKNYASLSENIRFREVNPNVAPSDARNYRVRQNNTVVVKVEKNHRKLAPFDLVRMRRRGKNMFRGEPAVTGALKQLTTVTDRTIRMATGHGEIGTGGASRGRSVSKLRSTLEDEGFTVDSWDPLKNEHPDTRDLIVGLDPQSSYSPGIVENLHEWYRRGGNLLLAGNLRNRSEFNSLLQPFNLNMRNRQILGQNWQFYYRTLGDPFLFAPSLESHPILQPLKDEKLNVLMGRSAPLSADTETMKPLLKTSARAYSKPVKQSSRELNPQFQQATDRRGPFTVGWVSKQAQNRGKFVVFSNANLLGNQLIQRAGNQDFSRNLVNWFFNREISIGIQPKPIGQNTVRVTPNQAFALQLISLIGIPFLVLIWGGAVWWKRKNL